MSKPQDETDTLPGMHTCCPTCGAPYGLRDALPHAVTCLMYLAGFTKRPKEDITIRTLDTLVDYATRWAK